MKTIGITPVHGFLAGMALWSLWERSIGPIVCGFGIVAVIGLFVEMNYNDTEYIVDEFDEDEETEDEDPDRVCTCPVCSETRNEKN